MAGEDALRCLAVTADQALAAALAELLAPLPGVELAGAADAAALAAGAVPRCDVVLVSEEPGQIAPELVRQLLAGGGPPAVILAGAPAPELYRAAMAAGARGLVELPARGGELAEAIVDAARTAPPRATGAPQGPAVAVVGANGGSGSTTLALALARLASGLLIDLAGGYGDLAALVGCRPERTLADLAPLGRGLAAAAVEAVAARHPCGLRLVVGAGPDVLDALPQGAGAALIRDARRGGSPVIADAGCPRSAAAWEALRACDLVLVAVTPDLAAAAAARTLLDAAARRGVDPDVLRLVASRVGRSAELSPRGLARAAGAPVAAVVADDPRAAAALANGRVELGRWPARRLRRALEPLVEELR